MTHPGFTGGAAGQGRTGHRGTPVVQASWSALIQLVTDALGPMLEPGLAPVLAGSSAAAGSVRAFGMARRPATGMDAWRMGMADGTGQPMQAIDSTIRVPLTTRRPSPYPQSNDLSSGKSPVDAPADIDAEHAETWALVTAAQGGDGEAFGKLYDKYVDSVFRFIYYRVNDRALAEDFTSETFLRALRRISTINYQGRDIGAWFMTIARNIVFDHTKSARFRLELTTGDVLEGDEREPSPETAVLASLTNQRLMQAVNTLNDEQKECIVLRFLSGLSVAETAEVMGKNEGAIKALQHRAVKRLAGLVADQLR
ncbi:MAG: polymerase sigma-70 factor, subfamily [Pseudonocardiales bacterium]|jgi:RNA polymerase sigma-70 factor (ECF subfamily)|nr:polymerase sigma-70 factor, subfamily [Pseudonocardiales bacterium]